jgi:hypothetical protein
LSEIAEWESFLVAMAGAAAALAGLLVVAISITLREILRYPWLPGRAAETVIFLGAALVASGLALLPGQSLTVVGVELVLVGVFAWALPSTLQVRLHLHPPTTSDRRPQPYTIATRVGLTQVATLPTIAGGIILISGSENGMYFFAAGILATFFVALVNAWILLVEVLR